MSFSCPTIDPSAGTASTLLESIDCNVHNLVEQSYGALLSPQSNFSALVTMALTIYVAILGYQFILGRASFSVGELVPRMALIGVILALTTQWATYQTLVYDIVTDGPQELSVLVAGNDSSPADLAERVDYATLSINSLSESWTSSGLREINEITDAPIAQTSSIAEAANAARARAEAGEGIEPNLSNNVNANIRASTSSNALSSGPTLLLLSSTILMLIWAGSLAASKIIIALLLGLGPVLLLCALFQATRGLTIGWARACLFLTFFPLLVSLTTFAGLALIEPLIAGMQQDALNDEYHLNAALGLLVAMITMAVMTLLIMKISTMIVTNWGENFVRSFAQKPIAEPQSSIVQNMNMTGQNPGYAQQSRADVLIHNMTSQTMNNPSIAGYAANNVSYGLSNYSINNANSRKVDQASNAVPKQNNAAVSLKPARGTS